MVSPPQVMLFLPVKDVCLQGTISIYHRPYAKRAYRCRRQKEHRFHVAVGNVW